MLITQINREWETDDSGEKERQSHALGSLQAVSNTDITPAFGEFVIKSRLEALFAPHAVSRYN